MPKYYRVYACLILGLALLFYLFWQVSKHNPALSAVNPFADDPYDAVGSFGVQLAIFTALLSLLRAFRPYQPDQALDGQKLLLLRGAYLSCLSILLTLLADAVALVRHPSTWLALPAGATLVALTGGMALLTLLVGGLLLRETRHLHLSFTYNTRVRALFLTIVSILILLFYPENWRQNVPGELFTVLVGIVCLLVPAWAISLALLPYPATFFEDILDDLTALYHWLKGYSGPFVIFFNLCETLLTWPFVHQLLSWLNPRKHIWYLAILLGIIIGAALTLAEVLGDSGGPLQLKRLVLVTTVYIGLECAGILLGYALLAQPLGLFLHTIRRKNHA